MRQKAKRDAIEPEVVRALELIGVKVERISQKKLPDLLCFSPREGLRLIECKSKVGKLTKAQQPFHAEGWPVCIVRSVAEALALYGVII